MRDLAGMLREAQEAVNADRLDDAAALLRGATALRPDLAEIWALLARTELRRCDLDAHDAALGEARRLAPNRASYALRAALACPPMMRSLAEVDRVRARTIDQLHRLLRRKDLTLQDPLTEMPNLTYYYVYHGRDDRPIHEATARVLRQMCPALGWSAGWRPAPPRPRLGVFSPHLRDHTIGNLFGGMIRAWNRPEVAVVACFVETEVDARSLAWASEADDVVLVPRHLARARQVLADARLDALVHLDIGMDPLSTYLAHARLAPVQATTWGHPVTTGIPSIDLFFSLEGGEPDDGTAPYTERLVKLAVPNLFFVPPEPPAAVDRAALGLPARGRLYGCPQAPFKLHPDFDDVLLGVLDADPDAVVVLHQGPSRSWRAIVEERLKARSPQAVHRIVWMTNMPRDRYIACLAAFDVMLDPFPFGGGNTTLEAFAVGTPVVTLPPPFLRGRLAYTFGRTIGWLDGVADSVPDYVRRAVHLAGPGRAGASATLRRAAGALWSSRMGGEAWLEALLGAVRTQSATAGAEPSPRSVVVAGR
jgi:predicted O-linked N-acetylglucosamine transferase (SPINDLY family)